MSSDWIDTKLHDLLGEKTYEIGVHEVQTSNSGKQIHITCVSRPRDADKLFFVIHLEECTEISWHVNFGGFKYGDLRDWWKVEVIALDLGQENYAKYFEIVARDFDLSVKYQSMQIQKLDQ